MLAAINVGGDVIHGLLYTVYGGLCMYVVVLLFLYVFGGLVIRFVLGLGGQPIAVGIWYQVIEVV